MKIRLRFVSNSSSSSFVIIGHRITKDDFLNMKTLNHDLVIKGPHLNEGQVFIHLEKDDIESKQMFERLKQILSSCNLFENVDSSTLHIFNECVLIYKTYVICEDYCTCNIPELKNVEIATICGDHSSPCTVKQLDQYFIQ